MLGGELGLEPGPRLRDLQAAILVHDPALELPTRPMAIPGRVPRAPTATVGRQAELADVVALVRDDRRRARRDARGPGRRRQDTGGHRGRWLLRSEFADGAWFVSLAELGSSASVAATIARTMEIELLSGEGPEEALARRLHTRRLLLVLDNFEHVLAAAPVIADLVESAEGVTVLVTSRESLRLRAERVLPVEPLPPAHAVTLFGASARAAGHLLTEGDARPAEVICARLDGLPLAIELAAGWTGTLAPSELLKRLDQALPLLVGGARDQPERQQTLRSTIEWSHRLLDAMEQRAFARFAVFPAGASRRGGRERDRRDAGCVERARGKAAAQAKRRAARDAWRPCASSRSSNSTVRRTAELTRERMARWMLSFAQRATPRLKRDRAAPVAPGHRVLELPNRSAAPTWALHVGSRRSSRAAARRRAWGLTPARPAAGLRVAGHRVGA